MRRAPCCATEYNDPISMGWDVPIIKIAIADTEGGDKKNNVQNGAFRNSGVGALFKTFIILLYFRHVDIV